MWKTASAGYQCYAKSACFIFYIFPLANMFSRGIRVQGLVAILSTTILQFDWRHFAEKRGKLHLLRLTSHCLLAKWAHLKDLAAVLCSCCISWSRPHILLTIHTNFMKHHSLNALSRVSLFRKKKKTLSNSLQEAQTVDGYRLLALWTFRCLTSWFESV